MSRTIVLEKGKVYFHAVFYDKNFDYPFIETFIYEGIDPEYGHMFKNANGEDGFYAYPEGEINSILDRKALSEWILENHSPTRIKEDCEYICL